MGSQRIVSDKIYGDFEVEEVLYELINSDAIKRLEKVHQGGANFLVNSKCNVTRKEHSIGVMIIMKILGRDIKEQILGLIHDISHTAFSHVIDYVLDNKDEDFHEKIYYEMLESSEIPDILGKYNMDYKEILNIKSNVLDSSLPNLCADRIDYTIRDMYSCGYIDKFEAMEILSGIVVINDEIYVKNIDVARFFTRLYSREVIDYFMNPLNVFANEMLTKVLKKAIYMNVISIDDFKLNDFEVLDKIRLNKELNCDIGLIHPDVKLVIDNKNYSMHRVMKLRMVDPKIIMEDGSFCRISKLDPEMRLLIEESINRLKQGIYIKEIKG